MPHEPTTTLELDDERHQRRHRLEWTAERGGVLLIALILVAALLGLLGPGPLSYRKASSSDGNLSVEYYAIQRYAAPAEWVVRFRGASPDTGFVRLGVSRTFTDSVAVEEITPRPASVEMQDGRLVYTFQTADLRGEGIITIRYKHEEMGPVRCVVDLADESRAQVTHFVLP